MWEGGERERAKSLLSLEKAFLCGGLRVKHSFETRGERERERKEETIKRERSYKNTQEDFTQRNEKFQRRGDTCISSTLVSIITVFSLENVRN